MATPKHIVIDARIRRSSTGRYVDRLLEHLQAVDKTNTYSVLVAAKDDWQPKSKRFTAVACRYPVFSFNLVLHALFARQLYRLKPDLVHFAMSGHQPLFYFGTQVTTTHDLTMFNFVRKGRLPGWLHWLRMRGYHLLMWTAHRLAQKIIVPTEYVRDAVAKYYLFTNRKIVVTLEAAEPPLKAQAMAPAEVNQPFLLYVGSSFPHKNLRSLVEAFQVLLTTHPDLHLYLVGKKEYHGKRLASWIKSTGAKQVHMTGFVEDAELKWFYEHATAYVFPSLSEGFGLPPLEAMVHGTPVISSNATCLPEVCGEAAAYFDPLDVQDMVTAIDAVIGSPARQKELVRLGYRQAGKYSWERMATQTLQVYEAVLDSH